MKNIFNKNLLLVSFTAAVMIVIAACQKDKSGSPTGTPSQTPSAKLIRPDSGAGNTVLILEGSGLSDIRSILFARNNVPGTFNPNFNTDNSLVFRVPDTAFGGSQNIVFTNGAGISFSVPFRVIALASVASASSYSWSAGEQITLTGNNLDDVSAGRARRGEFAKSRDADIGTGLGSLERQRDGGLGFEAGHTQRHDDR